MISSLSWNYTPVKPTERAAWKVFFYKHDMNVCALHFDLSGSGNAESIVDRARTTFHLPSHESNVSLNSSKSKSGGVPYGLNPDIPAWLNVSGLQLKVRSRNWFATLMNQLLCSLITD